MTNNFAQNFEDIILWRAFRSLSSGVYVDVGANDPTVHSVTKLFYENGWKGINIEPIKFFFDKLQNDRTRDINLQCCVDETSGIKIPFLEVKESGLSTSDISKNDELNSKGYETQLRYVETVTLNDIWSEYNLKDVHFLKIDVEGMELNVLKSLDFTSNRPWVVVIESVDSKGQENYDTWENILLNTDYKMVYFDGINRFYLAIERKELSTYFSRPPNILDDELIGYMIRRSLIELPESVEEIKFLHQRMQALEEIKSNQELHIQGKEREANHYLDKAKHNEVERDNLKLNIDNLQASYNDVSEQYNGLSERYNGLSERYNDLSENYNLIIDSKFWKITYPLRILVDLLKIVRRAVLNQIHNIKVHGVKTRARYLITVVLRRIIFTIIAFITKRPLLLNKTIKLFSKTSLYPHAKRMHQKYSLFEASNKVKVDKSGLLSKKELSPRAQELFKLFDKHS